MSQIITLHTRIHDVSGVLDTFSELMNRVERRIHAELLSGRKWTGDLAVSLYSEFGISAKLLESAYAARQAKVMSSQELVKLYVQELKHKIDAKLKAIVRKTKHVKARRKSVANAAEIIRNIQEKLDKLQSTLDNAPPEKRAQVLQRYKSMLGELHSERQKLADTYAAMRRYGNDIHQHKRRLGILAAKLAQAKERIAKPSICFGLKKLFRAQHRLKENGFASHAEWLKAWRGARTATFAIEGSKSYKGGNPFARLLRREDGLFDLELRLPKALKSRADETIKAGGSVIHVVRFSGLRFHHRADELAAAIMHGIPVSVRFHRDETGWRIMPTFKAEVPETREDYSYGSVGVDLNVGFISVARTDRHGNVIEAFDIPMVTYGRSQDQSEDAVKKVAAQVIEYAARHGLPIVSEKLDFARKKRSLKDDGDARYARMLSSFVYGRFDVALSAAAARRGVHHARVNPAYTSIIGRVKFARRYGLSVHQSAALAIARRAMQLGEQPPRSFKETRSVGVSLNDAHHVTLELPVRKDPGAQDTGSRHVWSDWNEVVRALRDAHAARRPWGRRARAGKPRSVMGRNDLHSMVCRSRRAVPG